MSYDSQNAAEYLRENGPPEDYPGQHDEIRREKLIKEAVEVADRILLEGSDGSVEELAYLTARVAHRWSEKVLGSTSTKLLSKDLEKRHGQGTDKTTKRT